MIADGQRLSLLVVDDDEVDRLAIVRALSKAGLGAIDVVESDRAADGFAQITGRAFDCAFFDFRLPDSDGVVLLRRVRDAGVRTPVVVLTGFGDEQTVLDAMKAGATDYMSKSNVSAERIGQVVRAAIRLGNAERLAAAARASQERYANQLSGLADAAVAVNDAQSIGEMLHAASMHACLITGSPSAWVRLSDPVAVELGYEEDGVGWFSTEGDEPHEITSPIRIPMPRRNGDPIGEMVLDVWANRAIDDGVLGQLARLVGSALENARLYRAARRATQARDDVLAIVSHDMRNPLHTIALSSSYLEDVFLNDLPEAALQQTQIISRAVDRATRLIRDLLDVSRIEAGGFSISMEPVSPSLLIRDACDAMASTADAARIALTSSVEPDLPDVMADRERLQQVFGNLIGNAIKFTPAGGAIAISAAAHGPFHVAFSVRDSGQGISDENLAHIFDRFWQGRDTNRAGAGLGLAIAKGIVEAHNGTISATSRLAHGTAVTFELPAA